MMLVVFEDGSVAKATSAEQAATMTLGSEQADVMIESEQDKREFIRAHGAIVSDQIQRGIGF